MKESRPERIPPHLAPQEGDIRLFKSSLMERLSRITPKTVLAVYLPIIAFSIWKSFSLDVGTSSFVVLFLSGVLFWTLFEYTLHRYLFHFFPKTPFQQRAQFLFHGVHHQYPNDKDRLVMPVALSLFIAMVVFIVLNAIFGLLVWGFYSGFAVGYVMYDMMHYSIHHIRTPKSNMFKKLWKHHLDHHYRDTNKAYGVSTVLWDQVFSTMQTKKNDKK